MRSCCPLVLTARAPRWVRKEEEEAVEEEQGEAAEDEVDVDVVDASIDAKPRMCHEKGCIQGEPIGIRNAVMRKERTKDCGFVVWTTVSRCANPLSDWKVAGRRWASSRKDTANVAALGSTCHGRILSRAGRAR